MVKQYRKPHQFRKRKPIYRYRFFRLGILILIFLSSLFYFLFLAGFFQVKKINVAGLGDGETEAIEQLNLLAKGKLGKSIFLVNLNKTKEALLRKFPQIANVEIRRNFPNSLNVLITERKIIATFCQEFEEDKSSSLPSAFAREDKCFVLDEEGIIFQETNDGFQPVIRSLIFTNEINLGEKVVKEDKSSSSPFTAARVIEKEDLFWLLEINSQLEEDLNIPVKEFIISSKEKLIVKTQEGWELYFNLQENVGWQLTKLKVLWEEKIPEEKRKDLEYIELRFGNFANPKYKD